MIKSLYLLTRNRLFILVLMLFAANNSLSAQNLVNPQKSEEDIFTARIKQLSEFTDRFNYKTDFYGKPVDQAFMTKMPREKMLTLLFDLKDPRTIKGTSEYKEAYVKEKAAFVSEVREKNLVIEKHSAGIIAEAKTRVIFKGDAYTISLFLNQETVGKGSIKWVLLSAKGEIFDIFKEDTTMVRFIPPASHETDFINLKRALEDVDHLQDYASSDFNPDYLTIFFYCIKSGIIKFDYVEDVVYHIIDIPGWYIKVKDFNRNELNSGWLIYDISRINKSLPEFLKNL